MSKTPYEVRLELLKMAKEIHELNWNTKHSKAMDEWHRKCDIAMNNQETSLPSPPSIKDMDEDDIITIAEQLKKFVDNNQ